MGWGDCWIVGLLPGLLVCSLKIRFYYPPSLPEFRAPPPPLQEDVGLDDDEWALPDGVAPLLERLPVYTENTASGIALLWAPAPFNQRTGYTRRAVDVPLVNAWFMVGECVCVVCVFVCVGVGGDRGGCSTPRTVDSMSQIWMNFEEWTCSHPFPPSRIVP